METRIEEDGTITSIFGDNALAYQHLPDAQNLVSLTTDQRALDPVPLQFIGRLPRLEVLKLYACNYITSLTINSDVETNLFPALKHLFIESSAFAEPKRLWGMKKLVRGLTSVKISPGSNMSLSPLFLDFGDTSPHINTLTIEHHGAFVPPEILRCLSKLSLHTLNFSGFDFGSLIVFCITLGENVPLLKRLQLLGWTLNFWEIVGFTMLPELENLAVEIDWWPAASDGPSLGDGIQPCDKLRILECNPPPAFLFSNKTKLHNISRLVVLG